MSSDVLFTPVPRTGPTFNGEADCVHHGLFPIEARDLFSGEATFCPRCSERADVTRMPEEIDQPSLAL